jgi:hypothetical protein
MQNSGANRPARKDKGLLISFAETIGSAMGSVAAKTDLLSKPAPRRTARRKSRSVASKARKKTKSWGGIATRPALF